MEKIEVKKEESSELIKVYKKKESLYTFLWIVFTSLGGLSFLVLSLFSVSDWRFLIFFVIILSFFIIGEKFRFKSIKYLDLQCEEIKDKL